VIITIDRDYFINSGTTCTPPDSVLVNAGLKKYWTDIESGLPMYEVESIPRDLLLAGIKWVRVTPNKRR
jgi:hypothetical protein